MFGLGMWELIIIFIILAVLFMVAVGVVIFISIAFSKKQNSNPENTQSERLKELQKMKDGGLITEDEFNKKRNEIISDL
jgi:uncharacterized membrane protein